MEYISDLERSFGINQEPRALVTLYEESASHRSAAARGGRRRQGHRPAYVPPDLDTLLDEIAGARVSRLDAATGCPCHTRPGAGQSTTAGVRTEITPAVFDEKVEGWVRLRRQTPDLDDVAAIRTAASTCPTGSIDIEDADEPPLHK